MLDLVNFDSYGHARILPGVSIATDSMDDQVVPPERHTKPHNFADLDLPNNCVPVVES